MGQGDTAEECRAVGQGHAAAKCQAEGRRQTHRRPDLSDVDHSKEEEEDESDVH